jgi:coenzyme F420-0:L-glutamate ligase/coenzyme F420-1:gamma-L-glutamate ligase
METSLSIIPVGNFPEVQSGQSLPQLLAERLKGLARAGDILVVTQKVVSKAEGQVVKLSEVVPSQLAIEWAADWGKDPRQIEVVLRESAGICRMERGIIISRTRHGFVCANAGVDRSNSPGETVCLLPKDSDASAQAIAEHLNTALGFAMPVLISDSFGRAWRQGIVNVAVGLSGMRPFADYRGQHDEHGYLMEASLLAAADTLCAAAELVMGKVSAVPAALIRGYVYAPGDGLGLYFPALDVDLYVPGLLQGIFGSKSWTAARSGAKGGASKSTVKAAAARANGASGGRPRKVSS